MLKNESIKSFKNDAFAIDKNYFKKITCKVNDQMSLQVIGENYSEKKETKAIIKIKI